MGVKKMFDLRILYSNISFVYSMKAIFTNSSAKTFISYTVLNFYTD